MNSQSPSYRRYRFSAEIISYTVWLYYRFSLSFRDIEDLLAQRGVEVSYETIRQWCEKFGREYAAKARRKQSRRGDIWHLDDVFIRIRGRQYYLWRAVDQDGDVIDILVQPRRDRHAAGRFLQKLLKSQGATPIRLATDRLGSYRAARRTIMPSVPHDTARYANNRAEISHQPSRQRERQMRRFKSPAQAQRFLAVHGVINNLFRFGRHLLRAANARIFRAQAFADWRTLSCV